MNVKSSLKVKKFIKLVYTTFFSKKLIVQFQNVFYVTPTSHCFFKDPKVRNYH